MNAYLMLKFETFYILKKHLASNNLFIVNHIHFSSAKMTNMVTPVHPRQLSKSDLTSANETHLNVAFVSLICALFINLNPPRRGHSVRKKFENKSLGIFFLGHVCLIKKYLCFFVYNYLILLLYF